MSLQGFFAKPGTNLADGLELFRVSVVAGKEKSSINICPFAFAIVSPNDDEVQRIPHPSEVVFLELLVFRMFSYSSFLKPTDFTFSQLILLRLGS